MKLVSYRDDGGSWRSGVLVGSLVVDAQKCVRDSLVPGAGSVKGILEGADATALRDLNQFATEAAGAVGVPVDEVELGPPVPDPGKILCIGLNYRSHVDELDDSGTAPGYGGGDPVVFAKFANTLVGHRGAIVLPVAAPEHIDYEGELAVVIGARCSRVTRAQALDYVAGYTILNDVSARDLQTRHPQWSMAKSFDTSAPCGPVLVTRDEIPDPQALDLRTIVNGEVVQSASTAQMIFGVARLIEYLSSLITLVPGDIIATGTPAGIGHARRPPVYLRQGDEVSIEIDKIGRLSNPVRSERTRQDLLK